MKDFPPQPDHEHEWEALVGVLGGIIDGREADYVSTPITTGRRFLNWYHAEGHTFERGSDDYRRAHEISVIGPNTLDAKRFVEQLRKERGLVIEPTSLNLRHWTQNDYRHLWGRVIERYARRVVLLDGWQLSSGCSYEFYVAARCGIETLSQNGEFITRQEGSEMIGRAIADMNAIGHDTAFLQAVRNALDGLKYESERLQFKDEGLDRLAASANVAQFVSFAPGDPPDQRFCHVAGAPVNHRFGSVESAVEALLTSSPEGQINIRSYKPDQFQSQPFLMGLTSAKEATRNINELACQGFYTIANESVDIHDGGVSGVLAGGMLEFAPDDTPRCVERPDVVRLPGKTGLQILESVYGFRPALSYEPTRRVEFSLHPRRRGVRSEHTIIWEIGPLDENWVTSVENEEGSIGNWPNRFSEYLGDKVFGLLIADSLECNVPKCQVIHRRLAPFQFGLPTSSGEFWMRTAPSKKEPGRYPTFRGWRDPFQMMQDLEAAVPAVIAQESVASVWSGSLNTEKSGPRIEGVSGYGDTFMLGSRPPEQVPSSVASDVVRVHSKLTQALGPVSVEWTFDGERIWVLQLNRELSHSAGTTIFPGEASQWKDYSTADGIESLRELVQHAKIEKYGIRLHGAVGITSHIAEILRQAEVPSQMLV